MDIQKDKKMIDISSTPMMSKDEYTSLLNYLNKEDVMLEYGAGSSTLYFSPHVKNYVSIEHDYLWFQEVKKQVKENVDMYHGDCFYKNNNVHCDYENLDEKERWRPYFEMVHNIPKKKYDKILIDGRARAYCALEVYDYLKDDGLLFVHDYIGRKKYHPIIEGQYERINLVNSLAIFKKK